MSKDLLLDRMLHEIVIDSIGTAILAVDLEGNVLTMNKAAEEMYVFPKEMALGNSFLLGLAEFERPRFLKTHHFVVRTEKVFRGNEIELVNRAGKTLVINAYSSLIKSPSGEKLGVAMLTEDITEKKKMEKIMRRADKLAALGQLSLGLSHQIRTPLGTIKALTSLIKADTAPDEQVAKYLNIIMDEVNRLDELSRQLLDFAGESYLKLERVNINSLLLKVLFLGKLNRPQVRISIEENLQPDLQPVCGDSELLIHAFMNLMINAMDAIENEGTIKVATRQEKEWAVITISDSGAGIPPDAMEKIFNPFYTTKDNGTGLGLSIVHKIVDEHGGHIEVDSRLGAGTTFTIRLPARKGGDCHGARHPGFNH